MSTSIQELLEGRQKPVAVLPDVTVKAALDLMIEHDYSQLPIIDSEGKVVSYKEKGYMVTTDSILRSLSHFGITIDDPHLRVSDAMVKTSVFRTDSDLFDLLDDLRDTYAVLIVDGERRLTGIITSYDATEYFRQRAENMMLVEDIEDALKKYILAAFTDQRGEIDQDQLNKAIEDIMPSNRELQGRFQQALRYYLDANGVSEPKLNPDVAKEAFGKHLYQRESLRPFGKLTLNHYIDLFLHDSRWPHYSPIFSLDRKNVRKLLHAVRDTRNDLAHFRSSVNPQQHAQLQNCKDWLERYESAVLKAFQEDTSPAVLQNGASSLEITFTISDENAPVEEALSPNDSRYAPLALWLQNKPFEEKSVTLSFSAIEQIIGDKLPASARKHRAWWSNHLEFNPQARQWWEVGWRVSTVRMTEEIVVFTRIEERERAYIDFFSSLLALLSKHPDFPIKSLSPDGQNWLTVASLPAESKRVATLAFSFARQKRFRVELYIDTGDELRNKEIFQKLLAHKDTIEAEVGMPLSWERLENARASRIALYHPGSIVDSSEKELATLREWAVDAIVRLNKIMDKHLSEVL